MTPIDLGLAAAGRSHAVVSRGGRSSRGIRLLVIGLFAVSAIWVLVISLTSTPMETSLADLRAGLYPSRTSWLRLEGELEPAEVTTEGYTAYVLRDASDPSLAVTILASSPMPTGHADVTGQPLGGVRAPGTFEAFYADATSEPPRRDPWLLVALPALFGLLLLLGERIGYPVMRGESRTGPDAAAPLRPGEEVAARWNGRIGSEAQADRTRIAAEAQAASIRAVEGARMALERDRMDVYRSMPPAVLAGLAAQELAGKLQRIEHLNITPDLLGPILSNLVDGSMRLATRPNAGGEGR